MDKSREIAGNGPNTPVWPLLESNPGQARLVFPDDRFHMTPSAMKFGGSGKAGIAGLVLCLGCWLAWRLLVRKQRPGKINSLLVALCGIFGLIAVSLTDLEN